ncbi:sulfatase [Salmonella enterica]|nr:sulfatase [Salmonella enterica]EAZ1479973.1 sulfatase [Salmonella enterica]EBL6691277.1 sulfatase [Salmonella enterica]
MKKNLLPALLSVILCQQAQAVTYTAQRENNRPNIVFILTEDMNPRLGAYGDPNAITPNIDKLAKESVLFTNAFTMAGVSAPSRASLITGVPQHATGLQHMRTATYSHPYQGVPPSWIKGYPELLRRAGYFTYVDTKTDYQFSKGHADIGPFSLWTQHGTYSNMEDLRVPAAWQNFDLGTKPFYLSLNPQITHESGVFTAENAPDEFKPVTELWNKLRSFYTLPKIDPDKLVIAPYWPDTSEVRKELALFYVNINIMDQQVGNIVNRLKNDGLWDNTILIFAADNGDGFPRHKREGYDSGTHVPLIIHVPDKYKPAGWKPDGSQDNRLISFEDLAPTILGFTHTAIPGYMKGYNLSQDNAPKRQLLFSTRGRMDNQNLRSYYVRDYRYQYVQNYDLRPNGSNIDFRNALVTTQQLNSAYKNRELTEDQLIWFKEKPMEELYDIKKDPWQLHNIANQKEYAKKIDSFRQKLEFWRNDNNDTSVIPEQQLVEDLLDRNGQQHITLPPVAELNPVTNKIYIVNRTENASIGYSFDKQNWELYTGAFPLPGQEKNLFIKAVRYGWKESDTVSIDLHKMELNHK